MLQLKKQLKSLLNARTLTAAQLARRSGVPKQTISNWLAGVPPSGIKQLCQIAVSLNVSLDELCFGKQKKPEVPTSRDDHLGMDCCSPQTIFYMVGFDGFIKSPTRGLGALGGWSAEERLARPIMDFVHFEDRLRLHVQLTKQIQQGKVIKDLQHRILCKDGGIKWIRWDALVSFSDQVLFVLSNDVSQEYPETSSPSDPVSVKRLTEISIDFYRFAHQSEGIDYRMKTTDGVGWLPHSEAQVSAAIFGSIHSVLSGVKECGGKYVEVSLREESHRWILDIQGDASSKMKRDIVNLEVLRHWVKPYSGTIEQVQSSLLHIQIILQSSVK